MTWVVDLGLDKLVAQINAAAPLRSKESDGSIGDPAHAATVSAHNPEDTADSSDGNDPDNQVDARDITHDPRYAGSDMARVTEAIRVSRDRRVRLVIFNRRIFSSYATASRPAWTWGTYSGDNPHDKHAHVETNDVHNDETQDWAIGGTTMDLTLADVNSIRYVDGRVEAFASLRDAEKYGPAPGTPVPLVKLLKTMAADVTAIKDRAPSEPVPADVAAIKAALLDPDVLGALARAVADEQAARLTN